MSAAPRVDPVLLGYGDTFGTYGGKNLGDTDIYDTAIDSSRLHTSLMTDPVEFTPFEKTIKDFILARLGFPVVRVELSDYQMKTAIDEAITALDYHAPYWATQMASFMTDSGVNQYTIPTHIANNLNYVVYKKSLLSVQAQSGTLEFDFFIKYFQDNFLFSDFAVLDFYLLQTHLETVRKILSNEGTWDIMNCNILQLYPTPSTPQEVVLIYRGLDAGTMHPYYKNWIMRYSLAVAKGILAEIRGKYKSLPSPGGGASLNGDMLMQQSEKEKEKLKEELLLEVEEPPTFTLF